MRIMPKEVCYGIIEAAEEIFKDAEKTAEQASIEYLVREIERLRHSKGYSKTMKKEDMAYAHISDAEMSTKVRLLLRSDLDHEPVCFGASDRIRYLSQELKIAQESCLTYANSCELVSRELEAVRDSFRQLARERDEALEKLKISGLEYEYLQENYRRVVKERDEALGKLQPLRSYWFKANGQSWSVLKEVSAKTAEEARTKGEDLLKTYGYENAQNIDVTRIT